jgi:hypothetical protein
MHSIGRVDVKPFKLFCRARSAEYTVSTALHGNQNGTLVFLDVKQDVSKCVVSDEFDAFF